MKKFSLSDFLYKLATSNFWHIDLVFSVENTADGYSSIVLRTHHRDVDQLPGFTLHLNARWYIADDGTWYNAVVWCDFCMFGQTRKTEYLAVDITAAIIKTFRFYRQIFKQKYINRNIEGLNHDYTHNSRIDETVTP